MKPFVQSRLPLFARRLFPFALALALPAAGVCAQPSASDPYEGLARYQFGQSRQPLALIEAQIRQTAPSGYPALEARLLEVLNAPQTTPDGKRYICRWLALVGSPACVPAVAPLLTDPSLSHPARMALEPMPHPVAGEALRAALPKVKGPLLAGLIGSLGVRREAAAIPELSELSRDGDSQVAGAALAALGAIGTSEAAKALESLSVPGALARAKARAQLSAAGRLAATDQAAGACAIFRTLLLPAQPASIRVAALKGLIGALPQAEAVQLVLEMVQGEDAALRGATVAAYAGSADRALQDAVAARLPELKPAGQLILLGVLADQPEVAARAALWKVLEGQEQTGVRVAALEGLARHGEAGDVPRIVALASAQPAALAEAARKTLQRMSKPGVDEALVKLIEAPAAADRAIALSTLAGRRVESALPALGRLVGGADPGLATEAAKALGVMGRSGQLAELGAVLVRTEQASLRGAVEEAMKAICTRAADKAAASQALLATLARAGNAPARAASLRLLGYTGGSEALEKVVRCVQDNDPEVREAAVRTLVGWPEPAAAPHLVAMAKTTRNPNEAIVALREGCLRLAENEEFPMAERLSIYRSVLDVAQRPQEMRQAIAGLSQMPSPGALELLVRCGADGALRSDATAAALRVARQIGGVYRRAALAAMEQLKARAESDEERQKVADTLKAIQAAGQSPDGFILAWLMAGPYVQEGQDGTALFEIAFAPEKAGAPVDWRPLSAAKSGLVELDKTFRGENRVAYLRTQITSETAQEARLEMGSDDGLKVWLNGQVVHANNAIRPCTPGSDKARIKLQAGANTLLVKVTQGGGEWSACCRLRAADGRELSGVSVAPNPE